MVFFFLERGIFLSNFQAKELFKLINDIRLLKRLFTVVHKGVMFTYAEICTIFLLSFIYIDLYYMAIK